MKSISLKFSMFLMLIIGMVLSSCRTTDEQLAGINNNLVTVDDAGATLVNPVELKSIVTGSDDITESQSAWLKFMREEEKLARDLYITLGKDVTVPVFENIARAEQNHMDAVLTVLTSYSIADPASTEVGVFNNADLQTLYNTLLAKGKASLVDALKIGALVEETDILDLASVYELNPGDDFTALTEALMLGSRNHLRAFNRVLSANGVTYTPVALTVEDYTEIVNSEWERGTGLCIGNQNALGKKYRNRSGKGFMGGR
jgi:hypothetical protein